MKAKFFTFFPVMAMALAVAFTSCQKDAVEIDQNEAMVKSTSATGVVPVLRTDGPGGNVECDATNYAHTSGRINFVDGVFDGTFPEGFTVTVTDNKFVSWSYTPVGGMCLDGVVVIVKGGPGSNVYAYPAGVNGDRGLASPVNTGGNIADLSNLTFCFNLKPCEDLVCWKGETAWGGNIAGRGSAWWFYYDTQGPVRQNLYAGQRLVSGAYVEVVNGVMTIVLGSEMRLQSVVEPVKVQGYTTIPSSRPAAGRFTTYKGDQLSFPVRPFRFYALHLDVEVKVPCPPMP